MAWNGDYFDNNYWEPGPSTFGHSWSPSNQHWDFYGGFTPGGFSYLRPIGTWAQGYRPTKFRFTIGTCSGNFNNYSDYRFRVDDTNGDTIGSVILPPTTSGDDRVVEIDLTFGAYDIGGFYVDDAAEYDLDVCNFDTFEFLEESVPLICQIKPFKSTFIPGDPGSPGFPGQAYEPAYCKAPLCYNINYAVQVDTGSGTQFSNTTVTLIDQGGVIGFQPEQSYTLTGLVSDYGFGGGSGGGAYRTERKCYPPICYPEKPYIPPTPAVDPTPDEYRNEYDLGWNWDRIIAAGRNISASLGTDNVAMNTAGVLVGICEAHKATLNGTGRFFLAIEFVGDRVSVVRGGDRVWGVATRQDGDEFAIRQYEDQVAVTRNGISVYSANGFWEGDATLVASVYKSGDGFCIEAEYGASETTAEIATGQGDATLPPLSGFAGEGDKSLGDAILPALTGDAYGPNNGAGAGVLPELQSIGGEGNRGWQYEGTLPRLDGYGLADDAYLEFSGIGQGVLPALSAIGSEGAYGNGDGVLPALTGEAEGGYTLPEAQGGDASIPQLLGAAHGLTGGIGSADIVLPELWALAGEGSYAEGRATLPELIGFAVEVPEYDGLLNIAITGPEFVDFYGRVSTADLGTLVTRLEPPTLEAYGGGQLVGELAAVELTIEASLPIWGTLDVTLPRPTLTASARVTGVGELVGTLEALTFTGFGGGHLVAELPRVEASLTGLVPNYGVLTGTLPRLTMEATATIGAAGVLDVVLPELVARWGVMRAEIAPPTAELRETSYTVQQYATWVVNKAHNGVTHYPNYRFDYLLRLNGKEYLVRDDGLYQFGGDADDGSDIDSTWALPPSTFGDSREKRVPRFYLQGNLAGAFDVTTEVDGGAAITTRSEPAQPGVDYFRAKLPRGVKGHTWRTAVSNVAGADFEIEQADALIENTGRKI